MQAMYLAWLQEGMATLSSLVMPTVPCMSSTSMMTQDLQAPPSLLSTPAHPLPLLGVLTHCWSLAVIARSAGFNLCSLMGCQCARTLCRAALLML